MKFRLVEVAELSGPKCVIYTVFWEDDDENLFDQFLKENSEQYLYEVNDIIDLLEDIGYKHGARHNFFKHFEGAPGDGVCALYDDPDHNLRLYCIRYANATVILGGGGFKDKKIHALQEDPKLDYENSIMRIVSKKITQSLLDKDLKWDGPFLEGEILFNDQEEE